jgi:hypothetical protein
VDWNGDKSGRQAKLAVFITDFAFQNALLYGIVVAGHKANQSGFVDIFLLNILLRQWY